MRVLVIGIMLIVNLVLQSTFFQFLQIRGIVPNTAIAIIVSFALLRGSYEGAAIGFFSGLLQDIFFGMSMGYFAFFGLLTGFLAGKVNRDFYRENYVLPLIVCTTAVLLYGLAIYCTSMLFRGNFNFFYYFSSIILPETVYTAVFSLLLYRILFGVNDWIEEKERYRRKLF